MRQNDLGLQRLKDAFTAIKLAELRYFLADNKKVLMIKWHLRLDNIPKDGMRLLEIATKIPETMRQSLLESLPEAYGDSKVRMSDAINTLMADEEVHGAASKAELDDCRWTVLRAYLSGSTDPILLSYLSPKASSGSGLDDAASPLPAASPQPDKLSLLPEPVAESPLHTHTVKPTSGVEKQDVEALLPADISEIDEGRDEIIVRWKDHHPNFAEVVGIRRDKQWFQLSDVTKKRQLFPLTGDIYIWVSGGDHQGEFSAWKVRKNEDQTNHRTLYKGMELLGPVYRVEDLDARADEVDEVRLKLQEQGDSSTLSRTIFRLSDGLMFKVKPGTNLTSSEFPEAIEAWSSLKTVEVPGRELVLSPLPKSNTVLDIADVPVIAKRLLTQAESFDKFPRFTKSEASELVKWFSSRADGAAVSRRIEHIIAKFGTISEQRTLLEIFADRLLNLPVVKEEIQHRIDRVILDATKEKSKLTGEVEALRSQKEVLKKQVDAEKLKVDAASSRVTKAVRKAFDKALREGEETLGESAVLAALLGRHTSNSTNVTPNNVAVEVASVGSLEELKSDPSRPVERTLVGLGLSRISAQALLEVARIAAATGTCMAFTGVGAANAAQSICAANTTRKGALLRVQPGMIDSSVLAPFCLQLADFDSLCITNANTSAFELYGDNLVALIMSNVLDEISGKLPLTVLSFVDSPAALPPSKSLRYISLLVDLNQPFPKADSGLSVAGWAEQTMEELSKRCKAVPMAIRSIQRLAKALPSELSTEALTVLRDAFINGALAGS